MYCLEDFRLQNPFAHICEVYLSLINEAVLGQKNLELLVGLQTWVIEGTTEFEQG